ncbi:MAG TPA: zinc-ribbon domain-containing protein [Thermoanaerobaculia bacterium]
MEVRCARCQARYRIDDSRVGPQGVAMRCGKCGHTFRLARAPAAHGPRGPGRAARSGGSEQSTLMFAAPAQPPTATAADDGPGAALFGAPRAGPPAPAPHPKFADAGGRQTLLFGGLSGPAARPGPIEDDSGSAGEPPGIADAFSSLDARPAAPRREPGPERDSPPAASSRERSLPRPPPRALLAAVVLMVVAAGVILAFERLGRSPPPPAAVEARVPGTPGEAKTPQRER